MRSLLYFLIGFALQFVLWLPACAWEVGDPIDVSHYDVSSCSKINLIGLDVPVGSYYVRSGVPGYIINKYYSQAMYYVWVPYSCMIYNPPQSENGIMDGDEDGIDCGGSTGVECASVCPDGYHLQFGICFSDEAISTKTNPYTSAEWDILRQQQLDQNAVDIGEYEAEYPVHATTEPNYASPDYTPPEPLETEEKTDFNFTPDDPFLNPTHDATITYDSNGDYIITDAQGNITGAKITGEVVSQTTNSDGSTTTVTQDSTITENGTVNRTITTTTTDENGQIINQDKVVESDGKSVLYGSGSSEAVTGDQLSNATDHIAGSINAESGEFNKANAGDLNVPDISSEIETPDHEDISGLITDFKNNSPVLNAIRNTGVSVTSQNCQLNNSIQWFGTTTDFNLNFCQFEDFFDTLGYALLSLAYIASLYLIFRR